MKPSISPYEMDSVTKKDFFLKKIAQLHTYHVKNCQLYHDYLKAINQQEITFDSIEEMPYLPAKIFKTVDLTSVDQSKVRSIGLSSGTTGAQSKIYLDARTQLKQNIVLKEILNTYIGKEKVPLLVIDSPPNNGSLNSYSARQAGVMGFSSFASDIAFALDKNMQISIETINDFISKNNKKQFMIFGFTFIIWDLINQMENQNKFFCLDKGILFHGGGWKKLSALNISNIEFNKRINETTGLNKIYNYYGMIEQTGSLFIECEYGHKHASKYSEVLIRDKQTLEVVLPGEIGIIQVLSLIPESYPGHSILTEDIGYIGEDTLCQCGRYGASINIIGRLPASEARGCSDAY